MFGDCLECSTKRAVVNDALLFFWLDPELCPPIDEGAIAFGNRQQPMPGDIASDRQRAFKQRIRSGIAAAKARGIRLGRQPGQRPKSDRLASKVLALVDQGRSYRLIGREVGLSKNTVADIVKRHLDKATQIA